MEQLINMTDAVFLGRVGEVELGASALACMYYLAIYMLGFGFGLGIQVLVARKNGEGQWDETGKVFWQGQYFLLALALGLCLLSELFSPFLLRRMIASEAVWQAAVSYVSGRNFGLFFAFPVLAFRSFFVGITKTKILIVNSVLMVLVNVVLNYVLIFGRFGFPAMGISGGGYRFFAGGRFLAAVLCLLCLAKGRPETLWVDAVVQLDVASAIVPPVSMDDDTFVCLCDSLVLFLCGDRTFRGEPVGDCQYHTKCLYIVLCHHELVCDNNERIGQ